MNFEKNRILAIDVLRGITMFSLVFLGSYIHQIYAAWPNGFTEILNTQVTHYKGFGLYYYDLIFPSFLFLAGCSWPFSLAGQQAKGATNRQIVWKIVKRFVLLAILGAILFGLPSFDIMHVRLNSILGRIGFGWAVVALITLYMPKTWWKVALPLFVLYWLAFFVSAWVFGPDGADPWRAGQPWHIIKRVDVWLHKPIPDRYGPEGFFHDFGCICTAFVGYWAGSVLKRLDFSPKRKVCMLMSGAAILGSIGAIAWISWLCPLSKGQWNPTFILVAGAIDLAALGILYWIIDICECKAWTLLFVVVGANAFFVYFWGFFISFKYFSEKMLCGVLQFAQFSQPVETVVITTGSLLMKWLLLYAMYKRKIFVRI